MKRADALRSLSREHHAALIVAKALRDSEDAGSARDRFLAFWEPAGRLHFRIEEVLLPSWALGGCLDPDTSARFFAEHLELRRRALSLEGELSSLSGLEELGRLLHDHVRFEERELFPRIEADLDEASLERLGQAIEAAR